VKPRVALYSHDAQGLGHMRRNLAIAAHLVEDGRRSALLLAGAREAAALPMPPGVECLTLPALVKATDGGYRARSLDVTLPSLLRLRADTLCAVLESFEPDVLIVDKHPLGIRGELEPALSLLRARGGTRLVLGLREVLDEPAAVRAEWAQGDVEASIAALYDGVWVYGDPRVYDPVAEYGLSPAVAERIRYTGYLVPPPFREAAGVDVRAELGLPPGPIALCLLGGGQDGAALGGAFAHAPLPAGTTGVIVAGPCMPAEARAGLHRAARARCDLIVRDAVSEPRRLLACATHVISMGGYNSVCELLAAGAPALVVPRVRPRREQLIRARRLEALGLLDVLAPEALSPAALGAWLAQAPASRVPAAEVIDLAGLSRLRERLEAVLAPRPAALEVDAVVC